MRKQEHNQQSNITQDDPVNLANSLVSKLILGGFIAICFLILQAFITTTPDIAIYISLIAVAVAIPLLVGYFAVFTLQEKGLVADNSWIAGDMIGWTGMIGTIIGVDAALWHVYWLIGAIFLVSVFISTSVCSIYIARNSDIRFLFFN